MSEIQIAGVTSAIAQRGPKSATEAVVCVHGNPGPKEDWNFLMDALGPEVRCIAPDMPGYGRADRPRDFDYTVEGYARHLDGLMSELGVERAHLVAHDFGGPWVLRWAADHKQRVGSITLVNTGVLDGFRWHKFAKVWQTPVVGELFQLAGTRGMFRKALEADNPRPFPDEFIERIWSVADWGHKRAVLKLYRNSKHLERLTGDLLVRLQGLEAPCLVVWGVGDKYVPVEFAEAQRKYLNVEAVHLVEGCGHWPFVDDPDRVRELIVPFLTKHLGR